MHIRVLIRRPRYLLAGLALKQNDPMLALNLLEDREFHAGARFIRLMAFTQSHRFNCAFDVLRQTINTYKNFKYGKMLTVPYYGTQMVGGWVYFQWILLKRKTLSLCLSLSTLTFK